MGGLRTLTSFARMFGRFCTIKLMFLRATYCTSGSAPSRVTRGGAIFLHQALVRSSLFTCSQATNEPIGIL